MVKKEEQSANEWRSRLEFLVRASSSQNSIPWEGTTLLFTSSPYNHLLTHKATAGRLFSKVRYYHLGGNADQELITKCHVLCLERYR